MLVADGKGQRGMTLFVTNEAVYCRPAQPIVRWLARALFCCAGEITYVFLVCWTISASVGGGVLASPKRAMWLYTASLGLVRANTVPACSGEVWCDKTGSRAGVRFSTSGSIAATSWINRSTPAP